MGGAVAATRAPLCAAGPAPHHPWEQVAAPPGVAKACGERRRAGARTGRRGAGGATGRGERGAGPSKRASARHLARKRRRAAGPGGTQEGERERGGCGTYFRSGGQIIPAKGEARPSGPLIVWGGWRRKGGRERGNPAPLIPSPLPPPRVLADAAARGAWNTRHEPPPPLPPYAHAEPAPRARPVHPRACALPRPCPCVGAQPTPGGWGK